MSDASDDVLRDLLFERGLSTEDVAFFMAMLCGDPAVAWDSIISSTWAPETDWQTREWCGECSTTAPEHTKECRIGRVLLQYRDVIPTFRTRIQAWVDSAHERALEEQIREHWYADTGILSVHWNANPNVSDGRVYAYDPTSIFQVLPARVNMDAVAARSWALRAGAYSYNQKVTALRLLLENGFITPETFEDAIRAAQLEHMVGEP